MNGKWKRVITALLVGYFPCSLLSFVHAEVTKENNYPVKIEVNMVDRTNDFQPVILNNRTYVAARTVANILKYDVTWNNASRSVTLRNPITKDAAMYQLGNYGVNRDFADGTNDYNFTMKAEPVIYNGHIYIPISGIDIFFGGGYSYDGVLKTIRMGDVQSFAYKVNKDGSGFEGLPDQSNPTLSNQYVLVEGTLSYEKGTLDFAEWTYVTENGKSEMARMDVDSTFDETLKASGSFTINYWSGESEYVDHTESGTFQGVSFENQIVQQAGLTIANTQVHLSWNDAQKLIKN